MPYDDEQTKEFEKNFKQWTEQLKHFTPEEKEKIDAAIDALEKAIDTFKGRKSLTSKEEEFLTQAAKRLLALQQKMSDTMLVLGTKMFRNANKIYQHIKKKADEGDEHAIKALKDIEPSYQAMLREMHPEN